MIIAVFLLHEANSYKSQPGQGGDADPQVRDLRAQLLEAEAAHFSKTNPAAINIGESTISSKRQLEDGDGQNGEEDLEAKRRRILEETRDVDADSNGSRSDGSSEEDRYAKEGLDPDSPVKSEDSNSDDEEDETAELLRELEKIKRERAEQKEKEVSVEKEPTPSNYESLLSFAL